MGRSSSRRRTPFEWLEWRWPVILKYAGLIIAIYEVAPPPGDAFQNPSVLVLAGGMMGIQSVMGVREQARNGNRR